jgi:hypothetical protein
MEVISREQEAGERFVADIRGLMHEHNVFRGRCSRSRAVTR